LVESCVELFVIRTCSRACGTTVRSYHPDKNYINYHPAVQLLDEQKKGGSHD